MMRKYDLQVHTVFSASPNYRFIRDAFTTYRDLVSQARMKGLSGVAITDHNTISGALKFANYAKSEHLPIEIIVGEEVRTSSGDIIGLYLQERLPPFKSVRETLDYIREQGGLAVAPHPLARSGVKENAVRNFKFDALETENANYGREMNTRARELAKTLTIAQVGGSDAHLAKNIGNSYTQIPDGMSLFKSIKQGRTEAVNERRNPGFSYNKRLLYQFKHVLPITVMIR